MIPPAGRGLRLALALGTLALPHPAAAQDTTQVRDTTQAIAESTAPAPPRVAPVPPAEVPVGPLVPGTRRTFTRDSILWSSGQTLADLLAEVPGVYVARAGFLGQPHYVQYGGRGVTAIELFWDGVPMPPLGRDSVGIDPGRVSLQYLRRVDVEVLPGALRVYLVSERHEGADPRTTIRVMAGSFRAAGYAAQFQNRWDNGIGLDLAADFQGTEATPERPTEAQRFDVLAKIGWIASSGAGVTYQVRRVDHEREAFSGGSGLAIAPLRGNRTDNLFLLFAEKGSSRRRLRLELGLASSTWSPDSGEVEPQQTIRQGHARIQYLAPTLGVELSARAADARLNVMGEGRVGWIPLPSIVLSGEGRVAQYADGRDARWGRAAVGLYREPFWASGELAAGELVRAAALATDSVVSVADAAARFGMATGWLTGSVSLVRRDAFDPLPLADVPLVAALAPSPKSTYIVAEVAFRPVSAITFSTWYSDPVSGGAPDLQPPTHARSAVTLRSKFWRTFRSGTFDLKLQLAMESWSRGTVDGTELPGATFWEYHVAFQLGGFTAFWNLRNARLSDAEYVPGLPYARYAQLYGVKWEFAN